MCDLVSEDAWPDWPLTGPRTCKWVLDFMQQNGATPRGWHRRWVSDLRLSPHDESVALHEAGCNILELLCSFDQLNAPNLAAAEAAARQVQLAEEKFKDRLHHGSSSDAFTEATLFSGVNSRGLCICPLLNEYIAEELRREAAVSKERRKAREERALARPKAKSHGKHGKKDDAAGGE